MDFVPNEIKPFLEFVLFLPLNGEIDNRSKTGIVVYMVRIQAEPGRVLVDQI